jgi:hypothetical protein
MSVDVLHGNVKVVSQPVGTIVPNYIGMIKAFLENLGLIFYLLHFPTIILTVKLQSYLCRKDSTFFTANN